MKKRKIIVLSLATILSISVLSSCNRVRSTTVTSGTIKTTNPLSPSITSQSIASGDSVSTSSTGPTGYSSFTDTTDTSATVQNVNPNQFEKSLRVDHDVLNQWQATSVVASGGKIYFNAVDTNGLFNKKGTILKIEGDKDTWSDVGGSLLAMRHSMNSTLSGMTILNSSVFAIDQEAYIYKLTGTTLTKFDYAGGKDIAAVGSSLYIVTKSGTIEKTDENVSSTTAVPNLTATGGIAGDSAGNLYLINNKEVIKVDSSGSQTPFINTNLTTPIDLAVDSEGSVYVLDGSFIKRFNSNGDFLVSIAVNGNKPTGISVDENRKIYVSTYGTDYKDSKILVYLAGDSLKGK